MSEVKSFWCHEASNVLCVRASDFDNLTRLFLDAAERAVASERREKELQQRLTEADERADSFDRLYTSSLDERDQLQQRADVLERVEVRYRWLQKATPYQFKKIQDASVTDGGDVLYFHADRFDAAVDAALKPAEGGGDEAMSFAQIAQFNDDNDHCPEREE